MVMEGTSAFFSLANVHFDSSLVTDYSFMAGMTKLEYVYLFDIQEGTDLSALSGLTNVKTIVIDRNNFISDRTAHRCRSGDNSCCSRF